MLEEQPTHTNAAGLPQYTYKELVRRNFAREYGDLVQTDLELYLNDAEFNVQFGMSKVCLDQSLVVSLNFGNVSYRRNLPSCHNGSVSP